MARATKRERNGVSQSGCNARVKRATADAEPRLCDLPPYNLYLCYSLPVFVSASTKSSLRSAKVEWGWCFAPATPSSIATSH